MYCSIKVICSFPKKSSPRAGLVEVLTRYTAVKNPALYERMRVPGIDPNGGINAAGLAQDMAYYVASGRQRQAIDMSLILDSGFAERAVAQLGRYG
jgi:NitT/TauT family transport system substrate-binding protein